MDILDLSRSPWRLSDGGEHQLPAQVPGSAVGALINAGYLHDPLLERHEASATWVDERDWTWQCAFTLPPVMLAHDRLELRADGLDVLTQVMLGTSVLGHTANRFRRWRWDARALLQVGARHCTIRCAPAAPEMRRRREQRDLYGVPSPLESLPTGWIRTAACQYGWDWGPRVAGCALRGAIEIVGWSVARLEEVQVLQHHHGESVELEVRISIERARPDALHADIAIELDGRRVAASTIAVDGEVVVVRLPIAKPQRWYPRGLGAPVLYAVSVVLRSEVQVLDQWQRRAGLRTVVLERERDAVGESFGFRVNGMPFVAHGANWVPPHPIPERVDPSMRERLFAGMTSAHFNMLRIWGGGIYEDDAFYDRCDELGILVWQDLMLACAHVPLHDDAWVEDFLREVGDQVRRLRHHASVALWCGNNEFEMGGVSWTAGDGTMDWGDYQRLFDRRLPRLIGELDPQRSWWPCSPHTPLGDRTRYQDPSCGDNHQWEVWAFQAPLASVATIIPRFVSEFGFQSFCEVPTLATAMPSAHISLGHPDLEHRQRAGATGTARILHELAQCLPVPRAMAQLARASQLLQGIYLDLAIRTWRGHPERCRGQLYWQLNDTWPCISWSTIDHRGIWKLSHAMVARAFAPVVVTATPDIARGVVEVSVVTTLPHGCQGVVSWRLVALADGAVLRHGSQPARCAQGACVLLATIDCGAEVHLLGAQAFVLQCEGRWEHGEISRHHACLVPPRELALVDPQLQVSTSAEGVISVRSARPAYAVWLEADGSLLPDTGQGDLLLPGECWQLAPRAPAGSSVRAWSLYDLGRSAALQGASG